MNFFFRNVSSFAQLSLQQNKFVIPSIFLGSYNFRLKMKKKSMNESRMIY